MNYWKKQTNTSRTPLIYFIFLDIQILGGYSEDNGWTKSRKYSKKWKRLNPYKSQFHMLIN